MKRIKNKRLTEREVFMQALNFEITEMDLSNFKNIQKSGFAVDVSSEGIGLVTDYALKRGDVLKVYFPINKVNITLPVYAKVVWSKHADNNFRAGLLVLG